MGRALSIRHTAVPSATRAEFEARARRLQQHYTGQGCRYWLFEEASLSGAYVEFVEAKDPDVLQGAHAGAEGALAPATRVYVEVKLS